MNKYIDIYKNQISHILTDRYGIRKSKEVSYGVGLELGIWLWTPSIIIVAISTSRSPDLGF